MLFDSVDVCAPLFDCDEFSASSTLPPTEDVVSPEALAFTAPEFVELSAKDPGVLEDPLPPKEFVLALPVELALTPCGLELLPLMPFDPLFPKASDEIEQLVS